MDMLGTSRRSVDVAGTRTEGLRMRAVQFMPPLLGFPCATRNFCDPRASMRDPKF